MELERIAAVIRPRRGWEAVDLGFGMARAWWPAIARAWAAAVLPVWGLVFLLFRSSPLTVLLILWWAKPLFDRVPLFVLSRALFGATPRLGEVLRALPSLWMSHAFSALTWRRLDPTRSFTLPVIQLESLDGSEHRQRLAVLRRGDAEIARLLTLTCLGLEQVTLLGLLGLLGMMRPETVELPLWELLAAWGEGSTPLWLSALIVAMACVATGLIEPFYVAGGFALYLNRRTHLEGWDVEIAFRRLARRLSAERATGARRRAGASRLAAVLLLATLALPGTPAAAWEEPAPAEDPRAAVEDVLAAPEFQTHRTVHVWRLRGDLSDRAPEPARRRESSSLPLWLPAQLLEGLLWILVAAGVVALVVAGLRRVRAPERDSAAVPAPPPVLFGLDIRPETLPADVVAAARALWAEGRAAEALGLLYRGALANLVGRGKLPARDSWTEGDCLAHLQRRGAEPLVATFGRLTTCWQSTAYAHRQPTEDDIRELCAAWPEHFGGNP